jgi:hypothetical protein
MEIILFLATLEVLGSTSEVLGHKYGSLYTRAPSFANTWAHEGHEQVPEAQTFVQDPNHVPFPKCPGDPGHGHMQVATPCFLCILHCHSNSCLSLLAKLTASPSKKDGVSHRGLWVRSLSLSLDVFAREALPASLIPSPMPVGYGNSIEQVLGKGVVQACGEIFLPAAGVRRPSISEKFPRMMIVQQAQEMGTWMSRGFSASESRDKASWVHCEDMCLPMFTTPPPTNLSIHSPLNPPFFYLSTHLFPHPSIHPPILLPIHHLSIKPPILSPISPSTYPNPYIHLSIYLLIPLILHPSAHPLTNPSTHLPYR